MSHVLSESQSWNLAWDTVKSRCSINLNFSRQDLNHQQELGTKRGGFQMPNQTHWCGIREIRQHEEDRMNTFLRLLISFSWTHSPDLEEETATHCRFLPKASHGQRSLVGYSPRDHKGLDMAEWPSTAPFGVSGKEPACQSRHSCRECLRFNLWVRKIPWKRAWQPTPVFSPGESPWTEEPGPRGRKETRLSRLSMAQHGPARPWSWFWHSHRWSTGVWVSENSSKSSKLNSWQWSNLDSNHSIFTPKPVVHHYACFFSNFCWRIVAYSVAVVSTV